MAQAAFVFVALAAFTSASLAAQQQDAGISAQAARVQQQGKALGATIRGAMTAALAKGYAAAEKAEAAEKSRSDYAANKAVVDALLAKVAASRTQLKADITTFANKQSSDADGLANKYLALLKARLAASGSAQADEQQIVALRKSKQDLVVKWENDFVAIMVKAQAAARQAFVTAGSVTKDAKQREVVRAVAGRLLDALVVNLADLLSALTGTQFSAVESFTVAAPEVLHRIAVKAQAALI